jgi:hypothetical protein
LGYATNGVADELALAMLAHLLDDLPIHVEITGARLQASELLALVHTQGVSVVCFADLPPSLSSKTRCLVKRLRAALPDLRILVGRWGPPALADDSTQVLRDTGANLVASTLLETRTYLAGLVEIPRPRSCWRSCSCASPIYHPVCRRRRVVSSRRAVLHRQRRRALTHVRNFDSSTRRRQPAGAVSAPLGGE